MTNFATPEKAQWREEVIIKNINKFFGAKLPNNLQYITMPHQCAENGELLEYSEAKHLYDCGIIKPSQFYGIEIDEEKYRDNKNTPGNWINNDFIDELLRMSANNNLKPGFVNVDNPGHSGSWAKFFAHIISILTPIDVPMLLVGNFILKSRAQHQSILEFKQELFNQRKFYFNRKQWEFKRGFSYLWKRSNTTMGTVIFKKDM